MTTISIMHTKGGVGKTTSAMYLASVAAARGRDVAVVDADPQGSAVEWRAAVRKRGRELPFPIIESGVKLRHVTNHELVLIDTPPGTAGVIAEAVDAADLVIIPSGASPIDVQRVWPTLEITKNRPTLVLMTGVDLRSNLWQKVRRSLDREDVPVFNTMIPQRADIKNSFGRVPSRDHGYGDLLTEIEELIA
ncbi:ParA-like dsDNA partitioning protein [Gordonia phage Nedarya]|nr:ParA-like dsDNA partitioning protein [Gordonia phage Nedarya]